VSNEHSIDATQIHHNWDNSREPVLVVEPGDVVHFELPMTGDGQVTESSTLLREALCLVRNVLSAAGHSGDVTRSAVAAEEAERIRAFRDRGLAAELRRDEGR
jgi:hypothetical protein